MPRFQTTVLSDGSVYVKTKIPSVIWALAGEVGERWGVKQEQALEIMLDQLGDTLAKSNASILGATYESAFGRLLARDKVPLDGMPPIEVGKLHRSPRKNTASGFVGVYPNGRNFRAMAKDPNGGPQVTVGTYTSAEQAAWARYLFYVKHNMPYGEAETALEDQSGEVAFYREHLRKQLGREPTSSELLEEYNQALVDTGRQPLKEIP